jgi:hypothetical protein
MQAPIPQNQIFRYVFSWMGHNASLWMLYTIQTKGETMTNKKQAKGELYDTQGIEGLARVGDSQQTVKERRSEFLNALHSEDTMPPKKEKLTGREWIIQHFIEWNYGESNLSFGTQELHHAIDLTEAEERGKMASEFQEAKVLSYRLREDIVLARKEGEEKGRREEREKVLAEQGDYFDLREDQRIKLAEKKGRRETAKEIKAWFLEIELLLPEEEKEFDKRFLSKEKGAKP